ncbi:MAG: hypothetical protein HN952_04675 [Candidatus Cloacimonetes bacterium]|jgi:hypothetical protein|nr:hypothetical protein [Candidatus Cloacimonadota bacterium]MBT6994234.1 hypothetical protein [Candidatus Cloacimonadota bacterium]MBT7470366.1 hypothetical protein [Candidatus Cloacimonadota bacterium]
MKYFVFFISLLFIFGCAETPNETPIDSYRDVLFQVDMTNEELSENDTISLFINSTFVEMLDEDDNNVYTVSFMNAVLGRTYEYRFAINDTLEILDGNNRTFKVEDENNVINDFYNQLNPTTIIFRVNMNVQIANGNFDPNSDTVDVPGNHNGWSNENQMTDDDGDGTYETSLSTLTEGFDLEFKFRINFDWENAEFSGGSNRTYIVQQGENILDYWYNDEEGK